MKEKEKTMGENIEAIRNAKGWSRQRIINLTGITNLYMKEKGTRKITEQDINKLAVALQCSRSEIIGDVELKIDTFPETIMIRRYHMENMEVDALENINCVVDKIPISTRFLKENVKSENIIIVKHYGNCMIPYIYGNDDVIIDLNQKSFINNSAFLVVGDNKKNLMIRRASKPNMLKDIISLSCDNKENSGIQPSTINEETFNSMVRGRCVYVGRSIEYQ
jgi:transcriptional regulator with XRE-family HTH domain